MPARKPGLMHHIFAIDNVGLPEFYRIVGGIDDPEDPEHPLLIIEWLDEHAQLRRADFIPSPDGTRWLYEGDHAEMAISYLDRT